MTSFTYRIWIKASPEQIWDALFDPAQNGDYAYGASTEFDLTPGGKLVTHANEGMREMGMPDVIIDGEVLEVEAPTHAKYTWHSYFEESLAAEPPTPVTIDIAPANPMMFPEGGVSQVTLIHDTDGAPHTAGITSGEVADAGGGWGFILSDLKTKLETGSSFHGR
jgi:uncharacterized protein YndB with AHSA1/START domain